MRNKSRAKKQLHPPVPARISKSHFFDHSDLLVAKVFVNLLQEIFVLLVAAIIPQGPVPVDPSLHLDQKRVLRYL